MEYRSNETPLETSERGFPLVMVIRCIRDRDKEEIERISVNSDL